MTSPSLRSGLLALACAALAACASGQPRIADPAETARAEWSSAFAVAVQESNAGRHAVADQALADYAARFPASSDAAEASFWRALYKLDPANATGTPRDAAVLLDSYLATPAVARRSEALTLRRLSAALESRTTTGVPMSAVIPRPDLPKPDERTKDEEIVRLKEELARAHAELERIRRRLAQPKP